MLLIVPLSASQLTPVAHLPEYFEERAIATLRMRTMAYTSIRTSLPLIISTG